MSLANTIILNRERLDAAKREREFLNKKEAAAFLGISETTLYRLIKNGEIPCRKIKRRVIFNRDALRRWTSGEAEAAKKETPEQETAPEQKEG